MKCVQCIRFNRDRNASDLIEMYKKSSWANRNFWYKLPLTMAERDSLAIAVSSEADFIENGKSVCFQHSDVFQMIAGQVLDK